GRALRLPDVDVDRRQVEREFRGRAVLVLALGDHVGGPGQAAGAVGALEPGVLVVVEADRHEHRHLRRGEPARRLGRGLDVVVPGPRAQAAGAHAGRAGVGLVVGAHGVGLVVGAHAGVGVIVRARPGAGAGAGAGPGARAGPAALGVRAPGGDAGAARAQR